MTNYWLRPAKFCASVRETTSPCSSYGELDSSWLPLCVHSWPHIRNPILHQSMQFTWKTILANVIPDPSDLKRRSLMLFWRASP